MVGIMESPHSLEIWDYKRSMFHFPPCSGRQFPQKVSCLLWLWNGAWIETHMCLLRDDGFTRSNRGHIHTHTPHTWHWGTGNLKNFCDLPHRSQQFKDNGAGDRVGCGGQRSLCDASMTPQRCSHIQGLIKLCALGTGEEVHCSDGVQ